MTLFSPFYLIGLIAGSIWIALQFGYGLAVASTETRMETISTFSKKHRNRG